VKIADRDLRATLGGPSLDAARELLGARLVRDDTAGQRVARIVELEAYIGEEDQASHARFMAGKSALSTRNSVASRILLLSLPRRVRIASITASALAVCASASASRFSGTLV
jgi:hypothetical protein